MENGEKKGRREREGKEKRRKERRRGEEEGSGEEGEAEPCDEASGGPGQTAGPHWPRPEQGRIIPNHRGDRAGRPPPIITGISPRQSRPTTWRVLVPRRKGAPQGSGPKPGLLQAASAVIKRSKQCLPTRCGMELFLRP